jgi:hypothetical protein
LHRRWFDLFAIKQFASAVAVDDLLRRPSAAYGCQERRVSRWVHEDVLERTAKRLRQNPGVVLARRSLVEHPSGTMKSWTNSNHLLTRRLSGVSNETSLQILANNMKRAINLVGTKKIMETIAS